VATDASGNVYVADSGWDRIQKFDASYDLIASTFSIMQAALSNGYRWSSAVSA
jgi:hypothetical protein